jgi:hypothetical protein
MGLAKQMSIGGVNRTNTHLIRGNQPLQRYFAEQRVGIWHNTRGFLSKMRVKRLLLKRFGSRLCISGHFFARLDVLFELRLEALFPAPRAIDLL